MRALTATLIAAALSLTLFAGAGCTTSHTETDKDTMMGGHKHEETTTTKNPVTGDVSVEHKESKSN